MADYPITTGEVRYPHFSWSAIFGGTFAFIAVEMILLTLGFAIFASAGASSAGWTPGTGFTVYATIISIIALYVGGRIAGRLSGALTRNIGMHHGLVTFGMSLFSAILIAGIALGSTVGGTGRLAGAAPQRVVDLITTGGWGLFVALLLGCGAAMMGAAGEVRATRVATTTQPREIRPAA